MTEGQLNVARSQLASYGAHQIALVGSGIPDWMREWARSNNVRVEEDADAPRGTFYLKGVGEVRAV